MPLLNLYLQVLVFLAVSIILYFIWPFRHSDINNIPGPFLAKYTNLWRLLDAYNGRTELTHQLLHSKYGPAVQVGPNVISLSDPKLLRTIYNTRGDYLKVLSPNPILKFGN